MSFCRQSVLKTHTAALKAMLASVLKSTCWILSFWAHMILFLLWLVVLGYAVRSNYGVLPALFAVMIFTERVVTVYTYFRDSYSDPRSS